MMNNTAKVNGIISNLSSYYLLAHEEIKNR